MKKNSSPRSMLVSVLLSQIAWLASAMIFLLIFCAIAISTRDPDSIIAPLSLCALYLSAVIGGIFAVRLSGDGIVSGALSGVVTSAIVFLVSALPICDSSFTMPISLILLALIIPASVIGSILGHKRSKNHAKQRAKMRKMKK